MIKKVLKRLFGYGFRNVMFNNFGKLIWRVYRFSDKYRSSKDMVLSRCEMYLITIAYNNEALIEKQIELVKEYVKDVDYKHIIVDNSTDRKKRSIIKSICDNNHIEYVPIPLSMEQKICKWLSYYGMSHGLALNWTYYHLLCQRRPKRFALLDHDIFPIRDCNLTERLGELDFYGVGRFRSDGWYLWPGWCIFNFDAVHSRTPNFQPYHCKSVYLDAGGGNYFQIYRYYRLRKIYFSRVETHRIKESKDLHKYDDIYHSDCIQFVDDNWLHLINGSNYCKLNNKDSTVKKIMDDISYFQTKTFDEGF